MKKILLFCFLAASLLFMAAGAQAAAVASKKMASQRDVLRLFQTAMGNRYTDLNSNNKTGAAGVYDYIIGDGTYASIKIASSTVNTDVVYTKSALEKLDWFKAKFLLNSGLVLNQRDKDGIKNGMSKRYSDICAADWNTTINNLTKTYNTAVAKAEKDRKGVKAKAATATTAAVPATGEELCNYNYNQDLKDPAKVPASSSDYNYATARFIALEHKKTCINETYPAFYAARTTALNTLIDTKTAVISGADAKYATCIGNRISAWTWEQ